MIKKHKLGNDTYSYKYDKLNNITHIYNGSNLINKYYYDNYNQLIKEIDYLKKQIIKYEYDNVGNLLSENVYELDTYSFIKQNKYEYNNPDWEDQLTKFNNDSITYDAIGNPLTIGSNISLNWVNGRELDSYNDGINLIKHKYNVDGIRTSKTINNVETMYYLEDKDIIFEQTGNNMLYYIRSIMNGLVGFKYNNDVYYYIKNIQDDVIGLLDNNFNVVVKYKYDSWGKVISITDGLGYDVSSDVGHIANINPFRYRSYYYDKETKLYYLNSRYYNPSWGRFINADEFLNANKDIIGYNLYAYCSNDFINNSDDTGQGIIKNLIKKIINLFSKKTTKKPKVCTTKVVKSKTISSSSNGHNNLPTKGQPNSTQRKPNGDLRDYGEDGKATKDTDYSHPERHPDLQNPHSHDWVWNGNMPSRGPAYNPNVNKIIAETTIAIGAGYLIYRGIRMLPSLIPAFWWSIPINVATP